MFLTIKKPSGKTYKCYVCSNTRFELKKILLSKNTNIINCECSLCSVINIIPMGYVDIHTMRVTS